MSTGFGVDLDRLDDIWQAKLPEALSNMEGASAQLDQANSVADRAFSGPSPDLCAAPYQGWQMTYTLLWTALRNNHDNLELCQEALQEVVKRYRAADGQH